MAKSDNYGDLRDFMIANAPKTVEEWNEIRDQAKKVFTDATISRLDGSGLISKLIKPITRRQDDDDTEQN